MEAGITISRFIQSSSQRCTVSCWSKKGRDSLQRPQRPSHCAISYDEKCREWWSSEAPTQCPKDTQVDYYVKQSSGHPKQRYLYCGSRYSLGDPEDLLSDDLGAWEQTKTRSKWYLVKFKTNREVCDVTKVEDKLDDSYQVCRRPYINKSDRSLRKTVVNVIHPDGHHHNLVFVKYHFEGTKEHPINVKPHGNSSKCSIPYLRTYRSTICKLKDTVARQHSGLKRAVHEVEEAVGG